MNYRRYEFGRSRITVGFDIEFALLNTRGNLVSAIPYLSGTKNTPFFVGEANGNIQRDNVAFEIAVNYDISADQLVQRTRNILQSGLDMLPKGYSLACIPSSVYTTKELKHPEAQEFGCDPDYDAKTGKVNEFKDIVDPNLRSFGFHVHTGHDHLHPRTHILASDLTLGLFSTLKDNSPDALMRRKLYGKPSCYRLKPYGVEYRTLSNYFCKSPRLMRMAWTLNQLAYHIATVHPQTIFEAVDMFELSDIIMTGNELAAAEIFFEHVHRHCDHDLQRYIIDELEYDNYSSFEDEWSLNHDGQSKTVNQALRSDYFQPPNVILEAHHE